MTRALISPSLHMPDPERNEPIMSDDEQSWTWQSAVDDSIAGLAPTERVPKHRGLARIAVAYASILDANDGDPETLAEFGPKLQSALIALGCAPAKALPRSTGGGDNSDGDGRATLTLLRNTWGPQAG